jgi:hypothetical protein
MERRRTRHYTYHKPWAEPAGARDRRLVVLLTEQELRLINEKAEHTGLSNSSAVRRVLLRWARRK